MTLRKHIQDCTQAFGTLVKPCSDCVTYYMSGMEMCDLVFQLMFSSAAVLRFGEGHTTYAAPICNIKVGTQD